MLSNIPRTISSSQLPCNNRDRFASGLEYNHLLPNDSVSTLFFQPSTSGVAQIFHCLVSVSHSIGRPASSRYCVWRVRVYWSTWRGWCLWNSPIGDDASMIPERREFHPSGSSLLTTCYRLKVRRPAFNSLDLRQTLDIVHPVRIWTVWFIAESQVTWKASILEVLFPRPAVHALF